MLTLAIHTASTTESVALIKGNKVIQEFSWQAHYDESERLLPAIDRILRRAKKSFGDLNRIIVTKGPGPFSSLRIGVTVANVLGLTLKIPVFGVHTTDLWRARLPKKHEGATLLIPAGGNFVAQQKFTEKVPVILRLTEVIPPNQAKDKSLEFFGDLKENDRVGFRWIKKSQLKTFGQAVSQIARRHLKKESPIAPLYFKPPQITVSLKNPSYCIIV